MKKGLKFGVVLLGIIGMAAVLLAGGRRPYRRLDAAQVAFAQVRVSPPDAALEVTEIPELVQYLKDTVIYYRALSYADSAYCGQSCTFTLTMKDGSQTELMAFYPFLLIDGTAYRAKYGPCEALNRYANRLLESRGANRILEEPPALAVVSDSTSLGAVLGSYSWRKKNADGTSSVVSSDCAQPPARAELLPFETPEGTAELRFTEAPDRVLGVRRWRAADWGVASAECEAVPVSGNAFALEPGGYIYEITAEWDAGNGWGGTAGYFIYIRRTE